MTRTLVRLAVAALACAALSGCGPADTDRPAAPSPAGESVTPSPTPSATASPSVSDSAAPSAGTDSQEATPHGKVPLRERLLAADELAGFNKSFTWEAGPTTTQEPRALAGTCHRFSVLSIGALRVVHRDYMPAGEDGSDTAAANQLVAQFADRQTARRAYAVLQSWREDCARRLRKYDRHDVGAAQPVPLPHGEGLWYLLTYGPADGPDSAYFDAQGYALVGKRISVTRMALVGQDYNYSAGEEPMVATVQAAAGKLH